VLQCDAVWCSMLHCVVGRLRIHDLCWVLYSYIFCSVLQCVVGRLCAHAVCSEMSSTCVAVCCSALQCVAVCCSVLQCVAGATVCT